MAPKMMLSICIPTYNRAALLRNCLHSIALNRSIETIDFQLCISDNDSNDGTAEVVAGFRDLLPIKYHKNQANLGVARNVLNVVAMADGDFVWLIGDDDLLLPDALQRLCELINAHQSVDYFYVNSFHLTTEYVASHPQPFDTAMLPEDMEPFSPAKISRELPFLELIDPDISFDFLGGMFLAVFRRDKWDAHVDVVNADALADSRTFSRFDNTFVHVKVFASAFSASRAYFSAEPFSVCLTGAREWAPMYPFIRSVRLIEALGEYRKNGLPLGSYLRCRNFALRTFIPDLGYMVLNREISGYTYVNPLRLVFANLFYPNTLLSLFYYVARKLQPQNKKKKHEGIV